MKPSAQSNRSVVSNQKFKKNLKEREKRKSQGGTDVNSHPASEKLSPSKESNARLYAGIDADSVINCAEQTGIEHLSDEITNTLTEDINYKLRYIINDSLTKARLSGRNSISSNDLEYTFENLKIEKVYGATTHPNWLPFSESFYYLEDKIVNLVNIAEAEDVYSQYYDPLVTKKWIPEQPEISKTLKNYFSTMCQMLINNDVEIRRMALINISENCRIGPITEWFYNFGYILLSKDITYDCLTLRALDLIKVLENSPICRINASEKILQLLVRLILQRLLKSSTTNEVLKPLCNTLALLSKRQPLKEFIIMKILQKLDEVFDNYAIPIITLINTLGIEAIERILVQNLQLFLNRVGNKQHTVYTYSILESYHILNKANRIDSKIYSSFLEYFNDSLIFSSWIKTKTIALKKELNFAQVKYNLLRTQRKIPKNEHSQIVKDIEDVFEMPALGSEVRRKIEKQEYRGHNSEKFIIIGKTTSGDLLLPNFKQKKNYTQCHGHTMIGYNL